MKTKERVELDYDRGHRDGRACRDKGSAKPSWFDGRKADAGSPISTPHGVGYLDGLLGKQHRYAKGKRKSALV
jgi:hypothetical protein